MRIAFSATLGYVRSVQPDVLRAAHASLGALRACGHEVLVEGEPGGLDVFLPDLGLQWGLAMGPHARVMDRAKSTTDLVRNKCLDPSLPPGHESY